VAELRQEALDLAGWGFILYQRLEVMRAALAPPARLVGAEREARVTIDQDGQVYLEGHIVVMSNGAKTAP